MPIGGQHRKHGVAELFAQTAPMIREAPPGELESIVEQHDNHLVAIANAPGFSLAARTNPSGCASAAEATGSN